MFASVQATVTDKFLAFSASRGNDLRPIGLKAGCKWCLCANRWKEAVDAAEKGDLGPDDVPRVHLHATNESALGKSGLLMEDLKRFAAEPEVGNASNVPQNRKGGMGGAVKETSELANKGEMSSHE
ncbi:MAG: hypothetical protein M1818_002010 [Claussenomyces sp. TS43310]|nr:MAG: hypothetical protein M1818_002010 [Claussenomyces sp. TS43310]